MAAGAVASAAGACRPAGPCADGGEDAAGRGAAAGGTAAVDGARRPLHAPRWAALPQGGRRRRPARPLLLLLSLARLGLADEAATASPGAPSRRAQAANVQFQVPAQGGTNLGQQPSNRSGYGVDVIAGVSYSAFTITADSNLGTDQSKIKVKLVVFDIRAEQKECPDIDPFPWMPSPFDGNSIPLSTWAAFADTTRNSFAGVVFPRAGKYRLCYTSGETGTDWYLLGDDTGPGIFVMGALSQYQAENKVWCPLGPMQRSYNFVFICTQTPNATGCECMGKIEGKKRRQIAPYDYMATGLPDPAKPEWRVWVTDWSKTCGTGGAPDPNPLDIGQPPYDGFKRVVNYQGYEVHNFGKIYNPDASNAATFDTAVGTWRLCYCPGYNANTQSGEVCSLTEQQDYPQDIGRLIILSIITTDYSMAVYPGIRFDLYICCGSTECIGKTKGYGGCSEIAGDPRYKLVSTDPVNDYPYFASASGCRTATQIKTYSSGARIYGGHLGPPNCVGAADCRQLPMLPSGCVAGGRCPDQRTKPTFTGITIDASFENSVMVRSQLDVCYCDSECDNPLNWLKAGSFTIYPMELQFQELAGSGMVKQEDLIFPSTGSEIQFGSVTVNMDVWIIIKGGDTWGGWSTTGSQSREMKILTDTCGRPDRPCEMKKRCLSESQPDGISGHRLISGNTDYTAPISLLDGSLPRGQRWGTSCARPLKPGDSPLCGPDIQIAEAGWYAICYCDANCNEEANWGMVGRYLIVGPNPGQQWRRFSETTFSVNVTGWGLNFGNRLRVLSPSQDLAFCGQIDPKTQVGGAPGVEYQQTADAAGPLDGAQLWGKTQANNAIVTDVLYDPQGTKLVFQKSHGLQDGDRIMLEEVTVQAITNDPLDVDRAAKIQQMYRSVHEVTFGCDDVATKCFQVLIPVSFPAAEFPLIPNPSSINWYRDSIERFDGIRIAYGRPSPEGRGYKVCWSPAEGSPYVGQVGELRVDDPIEMDARLGLTTVLPMPLSQSLRGAPVVVQFKTGGDARYQQVTGPMHLFIAIMPGMVDNNASDWSQVLEPLDWRLRSVDTTSAGDYLGWDKASQVFCGRIFLELWSEDPDGFPMPDGCFYNEDTVQTNRPAVRELHIRFGPRNNLKANTQYMLVLNMNILIYQEAKRVLNRNFPDTGAVWVWSMDDYNANPFGVIELGRASPGWEAEPRLPPRDSLNKVLLLSDSTTDPKFDPVQGFKITASDGSGYPGQVQELTSYCISSGGFVDTPKTVAQGGRACQPCVTEEDCGNGNNFTAPNPAYTWCQSPIDNKCLGDSGNPLDAPSFYFSLLAAPGSNIERTDILRIFLHPLTQWNIPTSLCTVAWNGDDGCPGQCEEPTCQVEMVIGGRPTGDPPYPMNILRIDLPSSMGGPITGNITGKMKVGNLALPAGGFLPGTFSAELLMPDKTKPSYWPLYNPGGPPGLRVFKRPRVMAASIVTTLGDGNQFPFMDVGTSNYPYNTLYFRIVFGATLFAASGESIMLRFALPPSVSNLGYACMPPSQVGSEVPPLQSLASMTPSTQGKLTRAVQFFAESNPNMCRLKFLEELRLYARSIVFIALQVRNPQMALKYDDPTNYWRIIVDGRDSDTWYGIPRPSQLLSNSNLKPCIGLTSAGRQRKGALCTFKMAGNYDGRVAVLGKMRNLLIAPSNFGASQVNKLSVFFRTQQIVGSVAMIQAELWVEAPTYFDFGQYCSASHLDDSYYIPEGVGLLRMPVGNVFICSGEPKNYTDRTFNRAKIRTTGRLLPDAYYGFSVEVTNAPTYMRNQQMQVIDFQEPWTVWSYQWTVNTYWGGILVQNGVDGAFYTAKFNEEDINYISWGLYQLSMPPGTFGVTFGDLKPTPAGGAPTDITILPIIVSVPMRRATRIIAPSGYVWDFEQVQFRYKRRTAGVLESLILDGVEADMPISGVPARPVSPPLNTLTIDYMQGAWVPGVKYGFACKIRIPYVPPTSSANQFTIEFGYNEVLNENRLQAGVFVAPLVKSLINGGVTYTTSIRNRTSTMTFTVRTVSFIPNGGGLLITGPPNFQFDAFCQPKPVDGYPDFPPDITCMSQEVALTGAPEVLIYAGGQGIPPYLYKFTLTAQNPPQAYQTNLGEWMFQTFSQMSERITLDGNTSLPGYPINEKMGGIDTVGADLRMPPYVPCAAYSQEFATAQGVPRTNCDFENWQFWPALGGKRDDRPNRPSALVIRIVLLYTPTGTEDLIVHAPQGYVFDTDCKVTTYPSAKVFDDTADMAAILSGNALWVDPLETFQRIPQDLTLGVDILVYYWKQLRYFNFNQRYAVWPSPTASTGGAVVTGCKGNDNKATITLTKGLQAGGKGYVFRLDVLKNPPQTPYPNTFTVEYDGEASDDFEGVQIWAFTNISILPTTTASSLHFVDTWNLVTFTLKPVNNVPFLGHLRVTAPAEFEVPTACAMTVALHPDELLKVNISSLSPTDLQWAQFLPTDIDCQGDATDSSRARLLLTRNNKYLKAGYVYIFTLMVRNPEVTTPVPDEWTFESYMDLTVTNLLDQATAPGFSINSLADNFGYLRPGSYNANAVQRLDFNLSFPTAVNLGETIELAAPVTFYFSEKGSAQCPQYIYLQGSLRRTAPQCGANLMWWTLEEETIPQEDVIRFMVQVKNPAGTPDLNVFEVRLVAADGSVRSSRMISGYDIIPELENASVTKATTLPLGQCRSDVTIAATSPCYAVSSSGAILVTFTPTRTAATIQIRGDVNDDRFDFTNAVFQYPLGTQLIPLARSADAILAKLQLYGGQQYTIRVDNVKNPGTQGVAAFDLTTFTDQYTAETSALAVLTCGVDNGPCGSFPPMTARRDELLGLSAFKVLGYINVLTSSRVSPIYYASLGATVSLEIRTTFPVLIYDVLRITRPEGYTFIDKSLTGLRNAEFDPTDHGLDTTRVWSTSYSNPQDYYCVFTTSVPVDTAFLLSVRANLPTEAFPAPFWSVRLYRIQPLLDFDGEVLNDTHLPYPWIGRQRDLIGTNDGAFPDFLLVGPIPFTVTPTLQTPGAYTEISFIFNVDQEVSAVKSRQVKLDITGPAGFKFLDACFVSPINPAFAKCTGYRNTASLMTIQPRLRGTNILVVLGAFNPRITPTPNRWQAAVFTDDPTQYVRWSDQLSYEIVGMPVVYKGNNQLGESAPGFFTFSPVRNSPTPQVSFVITPPPKSGFRVFCTGISPLGFIRMPQCQSGGTNEPLTLTFSNASLIAGSDYTFGITVYNPGGKPVDAQNYWGLSLRDLNSNTFDANLNIPGLDLGTIPVRCYGIGWTTGAPRVLATVMVQIRTLHPIPAGTATSITIQAPEGIMYSEDSSARVIPMSLPLQVGRPTTIAGDVLVLNLDQTSDIKQALYNILFEVINPTLYPHDNTWSVLVRKNIDIQFSHVLTGYVQGQISPFDLTLTPSGAGSGATRAERPARALALAPLLLVAAAVPGGPQQRW